MENQQEFSQQIGVPQKRERSRNRDRSEGQPYEQVANKAVYKEADFKTDSGPAVSMTVVGETVNFTQHFNF